VVGADCAALFSKEKDKGGKGAAGIGNSGGLWVSVKGKRTENFSLKTVLRSREMVKDRGWAVHMAMIGEGNA